MLKFLVIVYNATKGFDTMKIKLTEDDENVSPAITPTKKNIGTQGVQELFFLIKRL